MRSFRHRPTAGYPHFPTFFWRGSEISYLEAIKCGEIILIFQDLLYEEAKNLFIGLFYSSMILLYITYSHGARGAMTKKALKAGRGSDQFMIRFPPGLRSAIAKRAAKNGRSVNTEIIEAIEQYLSGEDRFSRVETFFEKHRENIEQIAKLRLQLEELLNWSSIPPDLYIGCLAHRKPL